MSRDGKGRFYRQLKLDKETRKAIKLYRKFQRQVVRGAQFFDLNAPNFEREE